MSREMPTLFVRGHGSGFLASRLGVLILMDAFDLSPICTVDTLSIESRSLPSGASVVLVGHLLAVHALQPA